MNKKCNTALRLLCFYGGWLLLAAAPLSIWREPAFTAGRPELLGLYQKSVMAGAVLCLTLLFRRLAPGGFCLPSFKKLAENLVLGAGLGFFWAGGTLGLLAVFRKLKFVRLAPSASGPVLAGWAFFLLLDALGRELLLRGYLFDSCQRFWPALAVSSALAVALCRPGDVLSLLNVLGSSLLLSALRFRTGGAAAGCAAWFVRSLIGGLLFGGLSLGDCPSLLEFSFRGPDWLSGGEQGLGSGVLALGASLILSGLLLAPVIRQKWELRQGRG